MTNTPGTGGPQQRGRWVAIVTGAVSVLIGVLYLVLIAVLDARGPLQPPPPEALGLAALPRAQEAVGATASPGTGSGAPPRF